MTRNLAIHRALIPIEEGQAVSRNWSRVERPRGVTWHWSVTRTLGRLTELLGGTDPARKGEASAHYGVGMSFDEGIAQYVELHNRSWHAGVGQTIAWNGKPVTHNNTYWSGARSTIGIETVHMGYRRAANPDGPWVETVTPNHVEMQVSVWPDEQISMCIGLGKHIQSECPWMTWRDHHGHADLCPGYKSDVVGFPWLKVLRGIYGDAVPDVWSQMNTVAGRQRVLAALGAILREPSIQNVEDDGLWGRVSQKALEEVQRSLGLVENGMWTHSVNLAAYDALGVKGLARTMRNA